MSEAESEEYQREAPNEYFSQRQTVTGTLSYSKTFLLSTEEETTHSHSTHDNIKGTEMILSEGSVMSTTRNKQERQCHADLITA